MKVDIDKIERDAKAPCRWPVFTDHQRKAALARQPEWDGVFHQVLDELRQPNAFQARQSALNRLNRQHAAWKAAFERSHPDADYFWSCRLDWAINEEARAQIDATLRRRSPATWARLAIDLWLAAQWAGGGCIATTEELLRWAPVKSAVALTGRMLRQRAHRRGLYSLNTPGPRPRIQ